MNIICVGINSKYIHSSLAPWCLKAGVEKFCKEKHNVKVLETTINGNIFSFSDNILSFSPDIIAIPCYIWNINLVIQLCEKLKKVSAAKIVLGGPEVAYNSKEILDKFNFIDFVLSGEGEWTFSSFIDAVSLGLSLTSAEGLTFRKDDHIIINPVNKHTETPPSPYCDEYFAQLNGRIAYIESSRGCPFRCSYCLSGTLEKMRCFNLQQIFRDIIKLSNSGAKTVKFIDRTFNADILHCTSVLNFILGELSSRIPENVCFHFEISADILTQEVIDILNRFPKGRCQLEIGIQSYNQKTLKSINRNCNFDKLENNIVTLLNNQNIHIHTDLIAGLPFENLEEFSNTFNRAYLLQPHMLQLGFLKLLFGADINRQKDDFRYAFSSAPPYEIIYNKWLTEKDLQTIKSCEKALDRLFNSGRFLFTLDFLVKENNLKPFDLFSGFGAAYIFDKVPLDEFIKMIYSYFSDTCDKTRLRECILCDIASVDVNIHIPEELLFYDKEYKSLKKLYAEKLRTNVKIVICRSIGCVYVVDLSSEKNLRNRRNGNFFNLNP